MGDAVAGFELAVDAQEAGGQGFTALFFHQFGAEDDVDGAGFVFHGDEDDAAGGAGALAVGDDAGGPGEFPVRRGPQFGGGDEVARR